MDFEIKTIQNEDGLDAVLELCRRVLGENVCDNSPYTRGEWLERAHDIPDLLVYAEADGAPVAAILGRSESAESLVLGFAACDEGYRRRGITRALIGHFEENARAMGYSRITLGARAEAEGFYKKCGYDCIAEMHGQKIYQKTL